MSDFIDANPDSDFMSDNESRMLVVIRGLEKSLDRARAEIAKLGRERDALKTKIERRQRSEEELVRAAKALMVRYNFYDMPEDDSRQWQVLADAVLRTSAIPEPPDAR